MAASPIVERIDIRGDVGSREISVPIDVPFDPLLLQAAEEGLRRSVVPADSLPVHARLETVHPTAAPPRITAVLRALIGVDAGTESLR